MGLDLTKIRAKLIGLEETIINHFIERVQFGYNEAAYIPGTLHIGSQKSLFEERLFKQECLDSEDGRFNDPEERPFNAPPLLIPSKRKVEHLKKGMKGELKIDDYNSVNLTSKILESYFALLPRICTIKDDEEYGSSTEEDKATLRRIAKNTLWRILCCRKQIPD